MSDRLSSAYYETQQALQEQQQQRHSQTPISAAFESKRQQEQTMNFQAALQQRLHDYPSSHRAYDGGRGAAYYGAAAAAAAAYAQHTHTPYGYGGSPYMSHYYGASQYESVYNGRLLSNAGTRYSPYPHPHAQAHAQYHHQLQHGMYTPAGQQLIPSSVLHYPPRTSQFHQQQQQQQHAQSTIASMSPRTAHRRQHIYEQQRNDALNTYAAAQQSTQRATYLPMHSPYNSYTQASAMTHNFQHISGASVPLSHHHHHQHYAAHHRASPAPNKTVVPHYLEPLRDYHDSLVKQTELPFAASASSAFSAAANNSTPLPRTKITPTKTTPTTSVNANESNEDEQRTHTNVSNALNSPATNAVNTDCLTTSPPLISATGTDSGISNCSTRARSDSSQSTPIYSSEYPVSMSVESSSCVSYHCAADSKDHDDTHKEKVDTTNKLDAISDAKHENESGNESETKLTHVESSQESSERHKDARVPKGE